MSATNNTVTRRGFVAGAGAIAAGAATVSSAAIALADQAADTTAITELSGSAKASRSWGATYPWAEEPTAIADADVEEEIDADVAVVGLGVAGVAAFRAGGDHLVRPCRLRSGGVLGEVERQGR